MSRAALLRATCLSGLAFAASVPPAMAADLILNANDSYAAMFTTDREQVIVGDESGPAQFLIMWGSAFSSASSIVGNGAGANDNTASLKDPHTKWNTSGDFILGNAGDRNTLNIFDGAQVSAENSYIGFGWGSSSNTANVAELLPETLAPAYVSSWSTTNGLFVGYGGDDNDLNINNRGSVTAGDIFVGYTGESDGNGVTVTGAESRLSVTGTDQNAIDGDLVIGWSGSQNTLVVENGGRIEVAQTLAIGDQNGSNQNTATFRGAATGPFVQAAIDWTLDVGTRGQFNRVEVLNGANVWTGSEITIGRFGSDNSMLVDGAFSAERPSRIDTKSIYVGPQGGANTLTLTNGAIATSDFGYIGDNGNGNSVTVSGGAKWFINAPLSSQGSLFVGQQGSLNQLVLSEGGQVETKSSVMIGGATSPVSPADGVASNNKVVVAGWDGDGGQTRLISYGLTVGWQGSGNTVTVENGGILETRGSAKISNSLKTGNAVKVVGAGSLWSVGGYLHINEFVTPPVGPGSVSALSASGANRLEINDGGRVEVDSNLWLDGNSVIDLGAGATLTAGNLYLSNDSLLSVYLDDEAKSVIDIAGEAALAGALDVKLGTADLQDNRYNVLTAGEVTGTFGSLNLTPVYLMPFALATLNAQLEYTATGVDILFDSDIGGDEDLNINQSNVAAAFDRYYNGGGKIPEEFVPLLGMSGSTLLSTLDDLSGEVGSTGGANQMQQGQGAFLGLMLEGSGPQGTALAATSIYGMTVMPTAGEAPSSGWTMWGSAFGGKSSLPGESAAGSHDTDTDLIGLATGWDYAVSSDTMVGFAIAGGGTRWDLADGLGNGESTFLQFGARGTQRIGSSYLAFAGAYAWHWMETERNALGDTLEADFAASSLAGRIEGGHRFGETGDLGLTPYAALIAQASFLPDYEESGGSAALAFESRTATSLRSELGLRLDHTADTIRLDAGLAWAHDWSSEASVEAAFRSLPGASFTVNGAESPENLALVTAGAEFGIGSQTTLSARFDGEFGKDYSTYGGTLALSYNW